MKRSVWVVLACFFVSMFLPMVVPGAIDLVGLKKKEEERRKKISKSKQAVNDTNVNMVTVAGKSYGFVQMESETPAEEKDAPEVATPAEENDSPEDAAPATETPVDKTADFWKKQKDDLENRISQLKGGIASQESELNRLWSDFYTKNVAAEQNAIKVQITNITNQVEQKKLFLSQAETQLEELYENARKAGIPPGWLR